MGQLCANPKIVDLYQWASVLTAEQHDDPHYFKTPFYHRILRKLKNTEGQLIAITGRQGVGKTAMMNNLFWDYYNQNSRAPNVFRMKWRGEDAFFDSIIDTLEKFSTANDVYEDMIYEIISKKIGVSMSLSVERMTELVYKSVPRIHPGSNDGGIIARYLLGKLDYYDDSRDGTRLRELWPILEDMVSKSDRKKMKRRIFNDLINEDVAFFLDFPDYSKNSKTKMNDDFSKFQDFYFDTLERLRFEDHQFAHVVIFFQKELFGGHFLVGKMVEYEIKPVKPDLMVGFVKETFGLEPFTEDAMSIIARLSRGYFRNFKKYIVVCLEAFFDVYADTGEEIVVDGGKVLSWIDVDVLEKDWHREMIDLFPRSLQRRREAIEVLGFLFKNGECDQGDIVENVFYGRKNQASRILGPLEKSGHIVRVKDGRSKIVRLGGE